MYTLPRQKFSISANKRAALTRALQGEDGQTPFADLAEAFGSVGLMPPSPSGAITWLDEESSRAGVLEEGLLPLMQRIAPFVKNNSHLTVVCQAEKEMFFWNFKSGVMACEQQIEPSASKWHDVAVDNANMDARLFCFQEACRLDPEYAQYRATLSFALSHLSRYREAIKEARLAMKLFNAENRKSSWGLRQQARAAFGCFRETKDVAFLDEAIGALEGIFKATKDSVTCAMAHYDLACAHAIKNADVELVLSSLQEAIRLQGQRYQTMAWRDLDFQAYWDQKVFREALGASRPDTKEAFGGTHLVLHSREGSVRHKIEEGARLSLKEGECLVLLGDLEQPLILEHALGKGTWCVDLATLRYLDELRLEKEGVAPVLGALVVRRSLKFALGVRGVNSWQPAPGKGPEIGVVEPGQALVVTNERGLATLRKRGSAWHAVLRVMCKPKGLFQEVRFRGGRALVCWPTHGPDGHRAWWGCDANGVPGLLSVDFGVL